MDCPSCGEVIDDDSVMCPECDEILDASFLEEGSAPEMDDEGTDPGREDSTQMVAADDIRPPEDGTMVVKMAGPPDDDEPAEHETEPSTDVGARVAAPPRQVEEDEDDEEYEEYEEYEDEEPPPPHRPESEMTAPRNAPPARQRATPQSAQVTAPRNAPPARQRATPQSAQATAPRPAPRQQRSRQEQIEDLPQGPPGGDSRKLSLKEKLDFDTGSKMMDDYEKMGTDLVVWFKNLPAVEKVAGMGSVFALVTTIFPWSISLTAAGLADEHIGITGMGWLSFILAGTSVGLSWYRLTQRPPNFRKLLLVQIGLIGAGALWGLIALGVAAQVGANLPANPMNVSTGATYGIYLHLAGWTAAGIGAVIALKEPPPRPPPRR